MYLAVDEHVYTMVVICNAPSFHDACAACAAVFIAPS